MSNNVQQLHCVSKKDHNFAHNFDTSQPIFIIFGRQTNTKLQQVDIQMTHLRWFVSMPCKNLITALVHSELHQYVVSVKKRKNSIRHNVFAHNYKSTRPLQAFLYENSYVYSKSSDSHKIH